MPNSKSRTQKKISLINQIDPDGSYEGVSHLYASEIPAPSAAIGFEENVARVGNWQERYVQYLYLFLEGLTVGENALIDLHAILGAAKERYQSRYRACRESAGVCDLGAAW